MLENNPADSAESSVIDREMAAVDLWSPIPTRALIVGRGSSRRQTRHLQLVFATLVISCVASSLAIVSLDWNGVPVTVGPFTMFVTVYPPLILCTWALFWLGFPYAFVAAYVATLTGALASGMDLQPAILFAFADPLGLAVLALAYRSLPLSIRMRSPGSVVGFMAVSLVAVLAGSLGSFVWSHEQALGGDASFAVWEGWWIGAFAQNMLIVLPVMALAGGRIRRWCADHLPRGERPPLSMAWTVVAVAAFSLSVAVFAIANVSLVLSRLASSSGVAPGEGSETAVESAAWALRLVTWHMVALLAVATIGAMVLAVAWSRSLQREVEARTADLRESQQRYAIAAKGANDGLWDWDLQADRVYYSSRWKAMLGYGEDEIGNRLRDWLDLAHEADREQLEAALEAHTLGRTSHFECEYRARHRDGTWRWMLCRALCVKRPDGEPIRMAGSQTDVTERRVAEQQLLHDAFHDHLSGLPNRALFLDRVSGAIARARRHEGYTFAVLFLDLDRFKVINDSLGHSVGDELLVAIADRLKGCLRPTDTVARLGGDEFAVLLDDIGDRDDATELADRVNQQLTRPFYISGNEVFTSASIGIALGRGNYATPDDVLRDADTAMYRAKNLGKARHQEFDTAMHAMAMRQLLLETDLRRALERNELCVYYQPVVAVDTREVSGFEALLRWLHPQWGLVPQGEFLPLAEETGLIVPIGSWVLETACRDLVKWRRSTGASNLTMSVNLSGRQLVQPQLVDDVMNALEDTGLAAEGLRLEITESAIMEHVDAASSALRELRARGIEIDLDDFGTGYSSLSYLHRFPISRVKIDRSFVSRLRDENQAREIVRAIVRLADSLGMEAVAEGVEHEDDARLLREMECPLAQGYLYGHPVDRAATEALLNGVRSGG